MTMRRIDRAVTDPAWLRALLHRVPVGVLAATDHDEQPDAHPTTFASDEATHSMVIHSACEGRMPTILAANPRVCFTVSTACPTPTAVLIASKDDARQALHVRVGGAMTTHGQHCILAALHDWWQVGGNDIGVARPDTISLVPEGVPLPDAERTARANEPGDGSAQTSVVEALQAAMGAQG